MMTEPLPDLPQYRSHKIVRAGVIAEWRWLGAGGLIPGWEVWVTAPDGMQQVVRAPQSIFSRGKPQPGDYLVIYDDGYMSWSPKAAFEAGYTKLDEGAAMSGEPQHVHGQLREALLALPLAWPPNMGPRERKALLENVVIAVDSIVAAKVAEALRSRPAERA